MSPCERVMLSLVGLSMLVSLGSAATKSFRSATACESACRGERDVGCTQSSAAVDAFFHCRCLPGYFTAGEEDACEAECEEKHWSWFTYGTCFESDAATGSCRHLCGWRVRIWTTVFLCLLFLSALVALFSILPMLISSCLACTTVRKDQKQRKKTTMIKTAARENARHSQIVGPAEYDAGTIKSTAASTQPIYASPNGTAAVHSSNSRLYWPNYYYQ